MAYTNEAKKKKKKKPNKPTALALWLLRCMVAIVENVITSISHELNKLRMRILPLRWLICSLLVRYVDDCWRSACRYRKSLSLPPCSLSAFRFICCCCCRLFSRRFFFLLHMIPSSALNSYTVASVHHVSSCCMYQCGSFFALFGLWFVSVLLLLVLELYDRYTHAA